MGKIKFIIIFLIISIGICIRANSMNQRLTKKASREKTMSDKKDSLKIIEGQISAIVPQVIGDSEVYFMLENHKEIFVADTKVMSDAAYMAVGMKIRISFRKLKTTGTEVVTFEILPFVKSLKK